MRLVTFILLSCVSLSGRAITSEIGRTSIQTRSRCHDLCKRDDKLQNGKVSPRVLCINLCRKRRAPENEGEKCNYSNEIISKAVKGLKVHFSEERREANITWNKITDEKEFWEAYCIQWTSGERKSRFAANHVVPKDQQYFVIHEERDYWIYPDRLYVNVSVNPLSEKESYSLQEFNPRVLPPYTPPFPTRDPPKLLGSIIGGSVVGFVLLGALAFVVYCKKYRSGSRPEPDTCPGVGTGNNITVINNRPEEKESFMASYYPENMKHIKQVASIVNWFREKGYDMMMDKMASNEISSKGPMRWAERQIKKARKVLVFLSPGYIQLCEDDEELAQSSSDDVKRVWYEMRLLKNIYCNTHSAAKIVCILMDEKAVTEDLPPWAEVRYRWPSDREKILKRLNDSVDISPSKISVRL